MKQCFGYVRVSTQKQGEGVSLEAQKDAITHFARNNDLAISRWFEEKETAAKKGRPVFTAMVSQLKRGQADGLIIHKIDRSARNFADWAKIGDLADAGIDVHFASESLDFRSRGGRLSADIQAVIAADYIRNLREECLKGMRGRLKQGLYPWGAPIGYLNNGGGKPKTPDPERAPLVRQLFELYASGNYSIHSVRDELERRGLRSARGRRVTKSGVEKALSNPFYCGIILVRSTGETFRGVHEPLITVSLFDAVQRVKAGKSGKKITKHSHTYRGLFRCANCGVSMVPELQKGRVYYRCHTPGCPTTSVREDAIEEQVRRLLRSVQLSSSQCSEIERSIVELLDQTGTALDDAALQLQAGKLDSRLSRLTDAMVEGIVDKATYLAKKEDLLIEKQRLEEIARGVDEREATQSRLCKILELLNNLEMTYDSAIPDERRQIVNLTTSNRRIDGRTLTIEPREWIGAAHSLAAASSGAPSGPNSRTRHQSGGKIIARLIEASVCDDAALLRDMIDQSGQKKIA